MTLLSKITMTTFAAVSMAASIATPSFASDTSTKTVTVEVESVDMLSEADAQVILSKIDRAIDEVCNRSGDYVTTLSDRRDIQRCEREAFETVMSQDQYTEIRQSLETARKSASLTTPANQG